MPVSVPMSSSLPFLANLQDQTGVLLLSEIVSMASDWRRSQSRTVLSLEAVQKIGSVGWKSTALIRLRWPV